MTTRRTVRHLAAEERRATRRTARQQGLMLLGDYPEYNPEIHEDEWLDLRVVLRNHVDMFGRVVGLQSLERADTLRKDWDIVLVEWWTNGRDLIYRQDHHPADLRRRHSHYRGQLFDWRTPRAAADAVVDAYEQKRNIIIAYHTDNVHRLSPVFPDPGNLEPPDKNHSEWRLFHRERGGFRGKGTYTIATVQTHRIAKIVEITKSRRKLLYQNPRVTTETHEIAPSDFNPILGPARWWVVKVKRYVDGREQLEVVSSHSSQKAAERWVKRCL